MFLKLPVEARETECPATDPARTQQEVLTHLETKSGSYIYLLWRRRAPEKHPVVVPIVEEARDAEGEEEEIVLTKPDISTIL